MNASAERASSSALSRERDSRAFVSNQERRRTGLFSTSSGKSVYTVRPVFRAVSSSGDIEKFHHRSNLARRGCGQNIKKPFDSEPCDADVVPFKKAVVATSLP